MVVARRTWAVLVIGGLLLSACGGGGDGGSDGEGSGTGDGRPRQGGRVVYGLEAETAGGWCLPEAQLAISGIQIARTIYDTLTIPDENGDYVPWLAESVTPNDDFTRFTIELREGVKFHDGSNLTAEVVKNNLDAFRGAYPARKPLLFVFVYDNIAEVNVTGPLTVEVAMNRPWPAFPAYLYLNGRFGISAQAQLDDAERCDTNLIGTGPFMLEEWKLNDHLTARRNPDYWNQPYPYLDEIEYRPIIEGAQRVNAIQTGEINVMHTSGPMFIKDLRALAEQGDIELVESDEQGEVTYVMLNASRPPFDNLTARQALAYAGDREGLNEIINEGITRNASGPFAPGNVGYLDDAGYPEHDLERAKELVAQYEEETGRPLEYTLWHAAGAEVLESAQLLKEYAEAAGATVTLRQVEQAQLISQALGGDFDAMIWRNHPGGDPDGQYVWWHSGSPVNFGRFADPEIDRLLEEGRVETDPERRREIYEQLNRRFSEQLWNLWGQWTIWGIATTPEVRGVLGPDNPGGTGPQPGLATGHLVSGMWIAP